MLKLVVFLSALFLAAPSWAAAKKLPAPPSRPTGYVFLRDWAARNNFSLAYMSRDKTILMTNRWARVELANDSRRGEINGVSVWLSYPISAYDGKLIIHQLDLNTLLNPILFPKTMARNKKIRTIAVDAGHGGKDPGNQMDNHQEKKYALQLAEEVGEQLEKAGLKAYMVRRSDKFIDLPDRASIAHSAKADLFVSLHYNRAADPAAKGVETFCVTPFGAESTNGGEQTLRSYPGNKFDSESVLLAYEVQRSLVRGLDLSDRGVRRAGFVVLRRAAMPSILVEGGFMSNVSDAKTVYSEKSRQQLARAIVDGILAYKRTMERN